MSRGRRIALLAVVLVQLAVPLALAAVAAADLAFGREIRLRAQPVDPLDIFRGNYVVLRYDISTVAVGLSASSAASTVCVRLSELNGAWTGDFGTSRATRAPQRSAAGRAPAPPPAGRWPSSTGSRPTTRDAERAREIERSIGGGDVFVVIDLDDDGSARIERLEADGSR